MNSTRKPFSQLAGLFVAIFPLLELEDPQMDCDFLLSIHSIFSVYRNIRCRSYRTNSIVCLVSFILMHTHVLSTPKNAELQFQVIIDTVLLLSCFVPIRKINCTVIFISFKKSVIYPVLMIFNTLFLYSRKCPHKIPITHIFDSNDFQLSFSEIFI